MYQASAQPNLAKPAPGKQRCRAPWGIAPRHHLLPALPIGAFAGPLGRHAARAGRRAPPRPVSPVLGAVPARRRRAEARRGLPAQRPARTAPVLGLVEADAACARRPGGLRSPRRPCRPGCDRAPRRSGVGRAPCPPSARGGGAGLAMPGGAGSRLEDGATLGASVAADAGEAARAAEPAPGGLAAAPPTATRAGGLSRTGYAVVFAPIAAISG